MARDAWSGVSKYSPLATITNKTKYFTSLANKVFELEKQKACTGHMFWAFAGIARPSDPTPSWIGDPPHERKFKKKKFSELKKKKRKSYQNYIIQKAYSTDNTL